MTAGRDRVALPHIPPEVHLAQQDAMTAERDRVTLILTECRALDERRAIVIAPADDLRPHRSHGPLHRLTHDDPRYPSCPSSAGPIGLLRPTLTDALGDSKAKWTHYRMPREIDGMSADERDAGPI